MNKKRELYYGDNLEILQTYIEDQSIDLCYIDPPFNSKRNWFEIYSGIAGKEDSAQVQAFTDTWRWGKQALIEYEGIFGNQIHRFTQQTLNLIQALREKVLGPVGMTAYLVSMTCRVNEIWHKLKPTGSFYLHCDPTMSHYLKLICDSIFIARQGKFRSEIIWRIGWISGYKTQKKGWIRNHDTILYYVKNAQDYTFNKTYIPYDPDYRRRDGKKPSGKGTPIEDTWNCSATDVLNSIQIQSFSKEKLGYDTQKPEKLLERIIKASSHTGDVILDAYCGCGTTTTVAEQLDRQWVGIDITYQSISLILKRLEEQHKIPQEQVILSGIPKDIDAAQALAEKQDDRLRKEFEKWAILSFTHHAASVNEKKGADAGIDGRIYFKDEDQKGRPIHRKGALQVKSGRVSRKDIAEFDANLKADGAEIGYFITLQRPTVAMQTYAASLSPLKLNLLPDRHFPRITIINIEEIINGKRIDIPYLSSPRRTAKKPHKETTQQHF